MLTTPDPPSRAKPVDGRYPNAGVSVRTVPAVPGSNPGRWRSPPQFIFARAFRAGPVTRKIVHSSMETAPRRL